MNNAAKNSTGKVPKPIKIPSNAAPQPNNVKGPRKSPRGARHANIIISTSEFLGIILPSTALK